MRAAWKMLLDAGVPAVPAARRGRGGALDVRKVRAALAFLADRLDALDEPDGEALHAWLRALAHHWPRTFRRVAGRRGAALTRALGRRLGAADPNRYLKLRRIAIENLAALA